jgi:aminopeptidase N
MNAPVFLASLLFVAHQTLSGADVRLPQTVSPRHYDVRLFPILDKGDFFILGQVSIDLECSEDTNRIVLHSADIVVDPQSVQVQFYNILNHLIAVA